MQTYYILVKGIVQGVGFRPFISNLAKESGLSGWVKNSNKGVEIKVNCKSRVELETFIGKIEREAPLLSHIVEISYSEVEYENFSDFSILTSNLTSGITLVSPDTAICEECLREIFDKSDRRYLYPFTNCTNCGPRYSIIKKIPYDRQNTTMADFEMCDECFEEYNNSSDRRFHAQPNCCPVCGPNVFYNGLSGKEAIKAAADAINDGKVLAVKGLGGYHLVADAKNKNAVAKLREHKRRNFKPFAVMARDAEILKEIGINEYFIKYIDSVQAPILIIDFPKFDFLKWINPLGDKIGVMIPYTPLHRILMKFVKSEFIVATSGNLIDEPIVIEESDAEKTLSFVDGGFLHHDRPIYNRVDDSVATVVNDEFYIIRRARGFAPYPIMLPMENNTNVLGAGAFLKNTVSLGIKNYIFSSQYIGDLQDVKTQRFFDETVWKFQKMFGVKADVAVRDLHPDFYSTKFAEENFKETVSVQHHVAHMMSVMAENGLTNNLIGIVFDGVGLGCDKAVWGGEIFLLKDNILERALHLEYMPQLGDVAAKKPYVMFLGYLYRMNLIDEYSNYLEKIIPKKELNFYRSVLKNNLNVIESSSMGRLFEAIGSVLTRFKENEFEAHTAIALENIADKNNEESYGFSFEKGKINFKPLICGILSDLENGLNKSIIAAKFHNSIVDMMVKSCERLRANTGVNDVALSGGVFQNMYLLEKTLKKLGEKHFNVFIHKKIPANDGGISAGQVYYYYLRDRLNKDFESFRYGLEGF